MSAAEQMTMFEEKRAVRTPATATLREMMERVAAQTGVSHRTTFLVIRAFVDELGRQLLNPKCHFALPKVGAFVAFVRKPGRRYNSLTGGMGIDPGGVSVRFRRPGAVRRATRGVL
jgi:hypothetical protein